MYMLFITYIFVFIFIITDSFFLLLPSVFFLNYVLKNLPLLFQIHLKITDTFKTHFTMIPSNLIFEK